MMVIGSRWSPLAASSAFPTAHYRLGPISLQGHGQELSSPAQVPKFVGTFSRSCAFTQMTAAERPITPPQFRCRRTFSRIQEPVFHRLFFWPRASGVHRSLKCAPRWQFVVNSTPPPALAGGSRYWLPHQDCLSCRGPPNGTLGRSREKPSLPLPANCWKPRAKCSTERMWRAQGSVRCST